MKQSKVTCDQHTCMLCTQCLPEWQPAITSGKKNIYVKKGEQVFNEGDSVEGIYFVFDGLVKVHKKWDNEKDIIVRFAKKGDILGHRGLGSELSYAVSATALENTILCFIDMEFFNASLRVNTEFSYRLLIFFADELKESERRMRNLAHMSVKARLAGALITLTNKFGTDNDGYILIMLSKQDLSEYIGTTYETLFRTLAELTNEGILTLEGRKIGILDFERLASIQAIK